MTKPICSLCHRTQTPVWHKSPGGSDWCNSCMMYYKSEGENRPTLNNMTAATDDSNLKRKKRKHSNEIQIEVDSITVSSASSSSLPVYSKPSKTTNSKRKPAKPAKQQQPPNSKLNKLPLAQNPYDYRDAVDNIPYTPHQCPVTVEFRGDRFDIGDYVSVRGLKHPQYFGQIVGFECKNSDKNICLNGKQTKQQSQFQKPQMYFWMKWLIPRFPLYSIPSELSGNDFITAEPETITCENMSAIQYVFDHD